MQSLDLYFAFVNPIAHLGERRYSITYPFFGMVLVFVLIEVIYKYILNFPEGVGVPAIILPIALIIYFSFRSGIKGGFTAVTLTLTYYLYVIYDRAYTGSRLWSAINTTIILGGLYFGLAYVIGWLRQKIDMLLEHEVNAKRRLITIFRQLPVGVVVVDAKGTVSEVNTQFSTIVGTRLVSGNTIDPNSIRMRYLHKGTLVPYYQIPVILALRQKKVTRNQEYLLELKKKTRHVLVSAAPIVNNHDEIVAGVAIYQDVTAIRELEKRKDDFVNMASHELKTPITSLVLYLSILKRRLLKKDYEKASSAVLNVEKQTSNLLNLINTLLDVSRYQTGKMTYSREEFRLDELVREVVDALNDIETEQTIIIVRNPKVSVYADRYRIYQVLANLITNAIKYSRGHGDIYVTLRRKGKDALVSVQDSGIGIPKAQHKKIFERLYQAAGNTGSTYPGFGMGLYISHEIISRHKGKIWVESEEGKGSTFYFTLPLTQ